MTTQPSDHSELSAQRNDPVEEVGAVESAESAEPEVEAPQAKAKAKPRSARKLSGVKKPKSSETEAGATPEQFLEHILGAKFEYTSDEVAELAGVSEETTRLLWRAMGFADVGTNRAFTKDDVAALKSLINQIDQGRLKLDDAIEIARAIGQSTARLAEWQGNTISRTLQERGIIEDTSELSPDEVLPVLRESEAMKPVMENLLIYSWRRQMAAAAARGATPNPGGSKANADVMSVGFADIVGFTRLSRQIPDADLSQLVHTFESVSADIVAGTGARLVKTLGDEVLFLDKSSVVIAETALRLHEAHRTSQVFPQMRIGLATGSVVLRMGDVFGTTVNRASRLTAMAKPGATFVDAGTFEALEDDSKFAFRSMRPRPARGFGLLRGWSMSRGKF